VRLIEVAHEVDAGLGSLRAESRQRIKVVASQTVAEQLMPNWLVSLQTTRPDGVPEVILTATNSERAIAAVRDELVIVVPPDHKWARRSAGVSAAELAQTPLVTREPHSGIRDSLTAALKDALGDDMVQAPPVLELSSAAAMRAAVLAGAGPAVMSRLAVADDLAVGRLRAIAVPELNLRRQLRAIWAGGRTPPAGAVRDLLSHITSRAPKSGR
ncbi:LysR substrate-binding domain-containing protein, partial [Mycobacterium sp.]|uniref:LysR substrate-binding domain-containing protein n=1 Tax=Mycobacterium sp. TaxID=1785 RepID=UPI0012885794